MKHVNFSAEPHILGHTHPDHLQVWASDEVLKVDSPTITIPLIESQSIPITIQPEPKAVDGVTVKIAVSQPLLPTPIPILSPRAGEAEEQLDAETDFVLPPPPCAPGQVRRCTLARYHLTPTQDTNSEASDEYMYSMPDPFAEEGLMSPLDERDESPLPMPDPSMPEHNSPADEYEQMSSDPIMPEVPAEEDEEVVRARHCEEALSKAKEVAEEVAKERRAFEIEWEASMAKKSAALAAAALATMPTSHPISEQADKRDAAACVIQTVWRCSLARAKFKQQRDAARACAEEAKAARVVIEEKPERGGRRRGSEGVKMSVAQRAAMFEEWGAQQVGKFKPKERTELVCKRCKKTVYEKEAIAIGGRWHRQCFKCKSCEQSLDPARATTHRGDPFHPTCLRRELVRLF